MTHPENFATETSERAIVPVKGNLWVKIPIVVIFVHQHSHIYRADFLFYDMFIICTYIYIMYVMLLYTTDTIWLFNIAMDRSTMFKFGKASISMGHRNNHGELLVITKGYNKQLHILIMLYTQQFLHLLLISRDDQAQLTVLTDTSQAISMGFPYGISMGFLGDTLGHCEWLLNGYPLVNIPKTMENHHF